MGLLKPSQERGEAGGGGSGGALAPQPSRPSLVVGSGIKVDSSAVLSPLTVSTSPGGELRSQPSGASSLLRASAHAVGLTSHRAGGGGSGDGGGGGRGLAAEPSEALTKLTKEQERLAEVSSRLRAQFLSKQSANKNLLHAKLDVNNNLDDALFMAMRRLFKDRISGVDCGMGIDEFVAAFKGKLRTEDGSDDAALRKLFMRIDADASGAIDWDEFASYALETDVVTGAAPRGGKDHVPEWRFSPAPEPTLLTSLDHHTHGMTRLATFTPVKGSRRYVTCGQDGKAKFWHGKTFQLMRELQMGSKTWVNSVALLPLSQNLAVASSDRTIKLYDYRTLKRYERWAEFEFSPQVLLSWGRPKAAEDQRDVDLLVVADAGGWVRSFDVLLEIDQALSSNDKRYKLAPRWKVQVHQETITAMVHLRDTDQLLCASLDGTCSIVDAELRMFSQPLYLKGHLMAVHDARYSSEHKLIASASSDKRILLWNPYSGSCLGTLTGHTAGIMAVEFNDPDHQLVSWGMDRTLRLWSVRHHVCLQTIETTWAPRKLNDISMGCLFDPQTRRLVMGCYYPVMYKMNDSTSMEVRHSAPLIGVLVSHLFSEIISADQSGTVCVWQASTGRLRQRHAEAHGKQRLTAAALDHSGRRLITADDVGIVKIWNYSTFFCQQVCKPPAPSEVNAIASVRDAVSRFVYVGGWDKKVTAYVDSESLRFKKAVPPEKAMAGHSADVTAMALMNQSTLVSASCDGYLLVWNLDSSALRRTMELPGRASLPADEQSIDVIAFLKDPLKYVLVSAGSDRIVRFWDMLNGVLLADHFTLHLRGSTISALAIDSSNRLMVTGDTGGLIKVWTLSLGRFEIFAAASSSSPHVSPRRRNSSSSNVGGAAAWPERAAPPVMKEVALWRGHRSAITGVALLELPTGTFVLSSGADCDVTMWSQQGQLVGVFGREAWSVTDTSTWRRPYTEPLSDTDVYALEMAGRRRTGLPLGAEAAKGSTASVTSTAPSAAGHRRERRGGAAAGVGSSASSDCGSDDEDGDGVVQGEGSRNWRRASSELGFESGSAGPSATRSSQRRRASQASASVGGFSGLLQRRTSHDDGGPPLQAAPSGASVRRVTTSVLPSVPSEGGEGASGPSRRATDTALPPAGPSSRSRLSSERGPASRRSTSTGAAAAFPPPSSRRLTGYSVLDDCDSPNLPPDIARVCLSSLEERADLVRQLQGRDVSDALEVDDVVAAYASGDDHSISSHDSDELVPTGLWLPTYTSVSRNNPNKVKFVVELDIDAGLAVGGKKETISAAAAVGARATSAGASGGGGASGAARRSTKS